MNNTEIDAGNKLTRHTADSFLVCIETPRCFGGARN